MKKHEMTVVEHLNELRRRLIFVAVGLTAGTAAGFSFARQILDYLTAPLKAYPEAGRLVFLTPTEAFFAFLKIAFLTGLILSAPLTIYQIGAFVWPALEGRERRYFISLVPAIAVLFAGGVLFAYKVILPFVFRFFLGFSTENLQAFLTLGGYLNFVLGLVLPFGVVFQLPVLAYLLTAIGIITPAFLRRNRKFAVLAIFVIAALLTPPDVVSQVMMAGPLLVLYEIGVVISALAYRGLARRRLG